jgi:hypothetical protein
MSNFRVVEHVARAQNVRERPGAVKFGHEQELRLAVKQYIPHDNPSPAKGDVTLIGAHANGFPKVTSLFSFILCVSCTKGGCRSSTSPFGMKYIRDYVPAIGAFDPFGLQMSFNRVRAVFLMNLSWEMIVSLYHPIFTPVIRS